MKKFLSGLLKRPVYIIFISVITVCLCFLFINRKPAIITTAPATQSSLADSGSTAQTAASSASGTIEKSEDDSSNNNSSLPEHFLLSKVEVSSQGENMTLKLLLTDAKHITNADPGPYGENYYQGQLIAEVYDKYNKLISTTNLNTFFSDKEPTIFRDKFELKVDDYNADGQQDFTVGQYAGSNYNTFLLFTISGKGALSLLPIQGGPQEILCSDFEGYYSTKFVKIGKKGFKFSIYDMDKGKYVEKTYLWIDGEFVKVAPNSITGEDRYDISKVIKTKGITLKDGSTVSNIDLINNLDITEDTIKYVYYDKPENIKITNIYEGSFTAKGKQELLIIFKLKGLPHVAGLDFSVAAIYEKGTLDRVSQQAFITDEAQFRLLSDSNQKKYLLYSGTTTYQGHSTCTLQLMDLTMNWKQLLNQDNGFYSGAYRFDILQGDKVQVSQPVFSENDVVGWKKKCYLEWNTKKADIDPFIPETCRDKTGKLYFDADSISPDGRYAAVSHEWGLDEGSYILIYDLSKNKLSGKYNVLAQEFSYNWSPDSKKLSITKLARIWIDTIVIDLGEKSLSGIVEEGIGSFEKFKSMGIIFNYNLREYRSDPYIQFCEWSKDSKKILMFYQWTDDKDNRQSGNFVYDTENKEVSRITQNKPDSEGGNLEPRKPEGFVW